MTVISRLQNVSVMRTLRADRQPEFTQIDMELSFVDVDDVIEVNERLLAKLFKEVLGVEVSAADSENDMAGSNGSFRF